MPIVKAEININESFSTLTQATARIPLERTNPATMTNAMVIATDRLTTSKLATCTIMPEAGKLQLQVGNDEDHADDGHQRGKDGTAVALAEEVRLSVQPMSPPGFPDTRQDEKRDHVAQSKVRDHI